MAKTARVGIAVVVGEGCVVLGTVVVSQLQNPGNGFHPLVASGVVCRDQGFVHQGKEIQAEFRFREVTLFNQAEA